MRKFISKNVMVVAAMAIAAGSYGLMSFGTMEDPSDPVTVYFHGDPEDPDQVAEEARWTTTLNGQSCNDENELACSMEVDASDLAGNQLDPLKIALGAQSTSSGYIPTRTGGSSSTPFNPTNRD